MPAKTGLVPTVTMVVSDALAGATAVAGDTERTVVVVTAVGAGAVTTKAAADEVLGVKAAALVGMNFAV